MLADLGALVLRLITCSLIFHHGQDKILHPETFTENTVIPYFAFLPGPPELWTYVAATVEILGCLLLAVGVFARPAAGVLSVTMLFALSWHLRKLGWQGFPLDPTQGGAYTFEPCLAFFGVTFYFVLAGPGTFAVRAHGF